eukprot:403376999
MQQTDQRKNSSALGSSFTKQEAIDLDNQGIDIILLKKIVKQLINDEKGSITDQLKQDFDDRLFALTSQNKSAANKLTQLSDLIALAQQSHGKSLPEALKDYTVERGLEPKLQQIRDDLISKQFFQDELTLNYVKIDELERAKSDLQKIIDNLIVRIQEMDSQKRQVNNDLTYMKSQFTEKVDSKDIRMLEKKLESCAPWESVRNIYKELSFYLKKDDFELNKADVNSNLKKMQMNIDTLIPKQEAMREIAQLRAQIYSDLEKFARVKDLQQDRIENGKMFQKNQDTSNEFRKSFAKIENDIHNVKRAIEKKANEEDLKETQKSLNHFSEKSDFIDLQKKVLPKIEDFEQKLTQFTNQSEIHDQIIRRYDEVISDKASKWNIQELSAEISNNFSKVQLTNQLQIQIQQLQTEILSFKKDSEDKFDTLNKQISQEIILAVKKVQKQQGGVNRMNALSNLSGGDGGGMGFNFDEIKNLINMKANTMELNQIMEMKTNKTDTEQLMSSQQILSRQLKHFVVMVMESIKLSINETMDTKMQVENKKKFIFNQLKALAKWILRFDPSSQNSTSQNYEGLESDFMLGEESKILQDFTDQILSDHKLPISLQNSNIKKSRDRYNKSLNNQSTILTQISDQKNQLFQNRRISNQMNGLVSQSINRSLIGTTCSDITHRTNESVSAQYQVGNDTERSLLLKQQQYHSSVNNDVNTISIDVNRPKKYSQIMNKYNQKLDRLQISSTIHPSGLMSQLLSLINYSFMQSQFKSKAGKIKNFNEAQTQKQWYRISNFTTRTFE